MKKRKAVILFGALLLSIVGYVAWCLRAYYMSPRLVFVGSVSPEGRRVVEEWAKTPGYPKPESLKRQDRDVKADVLWRLQHPWDRERTCPMEVHEAPDAGLWASHKARIWIFSKVDGKWRSSKVRDIESIWPEFLPMVRLHEEAEARFRELTGDGATIEIVSLDPSEGPAMRPPPFNTADEYARDTTRDLTKKSHFHGYLILSRAVMKEGPEKQAIIDRTGNDIFRGGTLDPYSLDSFWPRHGMIVTRGGQRTDYLFDCRHSHVYVFENGGDEPIRFRMGPIAEDLMEDFLYVNGVEQKGEPGR